MFNDLIEDNGVDLVLQGHEHAYGRMTAHDAEGKPVPPVYTVSHCSPKNYKIKNLDRFDIQNNTSRFYQTVKIFGDTISLSAYEVYGHTLIDSLLIVKSASSRPMVLPFPPAKSM